MATLEAQRQERTPSAISTLLGLVRDSNGAWSVAAMPSEDRAFDLFLLRADAKGNHQASKREISRACLFSCAGPSILTAVRTGCNKRHLLFSACPKSTTEASPLVAQVLGAAGVI